MRIHYLQHVEFEDLGSMRGWFLEHGDSLTSTHLYLPQALPSLDSFDMLVVMGGPMGVADTAIYPWLEAEQAFIRAAIGAGKKVLGICLGAQLIAAALGAGVTANPQREIGWFPLRSQAANHPIAILLDNCLAFHWHGDSFAIPAGAQHLASSEACFNQAFSFQDRVYGFQFHLETTPASATALVHHCGNELDDSRYVQSIYQILQHPQRFTAINKAMADVLALITQRSDY